MPKPSIALTLLAGLVLITGCSQREPEPEPVRAVRTMTLSAGAAGGTQEFAADVRARTESRLAFRVGGKLTRRAVELGDRVKPGQVLAQLDPEDLKQAQQAARAGLQAAESNRELVAAEYRRFSELRDQGFISAWELERRGTALKAAQAQLDQAHAQAQVQRNQADYATLLAPTAGVVTGVEAEPGAVVSAGAPVVRLALDGPRDVVFAVPEDALTSIRALLGKRAALRVRIWGSDKVHEGRLREVAASADPMTRTYQAKVDIGTAAVALGQTATVVVERPRVEGIIKLPLAALTRAQDNAAVWIVDKSSMTVRLTPVSIAGADGNEVVISAGLAAGQEVVTAGVHVLTAGQKVKFYSASPGAALPGSGPVSASR